MVEFDRYGHPVGVHFKGSGAYKTKLGAFVTLATYTLILFNLCTLVIAFFDSSKQVENVQESVIDAFNAGPYALRENNFEISILTSPPLLPELGRFKISQVYLDKKDPTVVPPVECDKEAIKSISEFWSPRLSETFGEAIEEDNSIVTCIDNDTLIL